MKQPSFASLAYDGKKKQTRKELFLAEMDRIIPWRKLTRLIEPHYPKTGNGRPPMGPEKMLRIHFMQQWFKLSDPAMDIVDPKNETVDSILTDCLIFGVHYNLRNLPNWSTGPESSQKNLTGLII